MYVVNKWVKEKPRKVTFSTDEVRAEISMVLVDINQLGQISEIKGISGRLQHKLDNVHIYNCGFMSIQI